GLIAELDYRHLRKWGHSDVLLPWLRKLTGLLKGLPDQVLNASLLARALAQQGKLDAAIEMVKVAGELNDSSNRQIELLFDLGGYYLRDAQLLEAERVYQYLIDKTRPGHSAVPFARAGLALCQVEAGAFLDALDTIGEAEAELAFRRNESPSG